MKLQSLFLSGRTHPPQPQPCPLQSSQHSALGVSAQTLLPSKSLPRSPREEAGTSTELPALHLLNHCSVPGCSPASGPSRVGGHFLEFLAPS